MGVVRDLKDWASDHPILAAGSILAGMAIAARSRRATGMGSRTWGADPLNAGACCENRCPVPVYSVPTPATHGAPSTMEPGGDPMGYLRGLGDVRPTGNGGSEFFTIDPSLAPTANGGPLSMQELQFLPQAQLTPQDQLAAAQSRNRRTGMRAPGGSGNTPWEIEKHARSRTVAPGETFQYIDLGLIGERF